MRKLLVLVFCFCQVACAGISAITETRKQVSGPRIGTQVGEVDYTNTGRSTKTDVLRLWGEPKRRFSQKDREYWVYDRDLAWRGVVVWVLAPIPLLVPVGFNETTVVFDRNDNVVSFSNEHGDGPSFGCSPTAKGGYSCW